MAAAHALLCCSPGPQDALSRLKGMLYLLMEVIILTLSYYLAGKQLYLANDGWLRDCGSAGRPITGGKVIDRAVKLLFKFLHDGGLNYFIWIDKSYGLT